MKTKNNIILDNNQINHKIRRIALQILESNINEQEILKKVELPCFVKPTDGGSSFGVSKVKKESEQEIDNDE